MPEESLWCCWISLVLFWAGISPGGTRAIPKYVCLEDSVQMFQNLPLDSRGPVILYKHGTRDIIIAKWNIQASVVNSSCGLECKEKVSLDECGTVWMRNVQRSDEGKYFLYYRADNSSMKLEAQIIVMVAPPMQCKPKIVQIHNILTASLKDNYCGKPEPSVNWLDDPGISSIDETAVKLHSEDEAGTYYACIKSPALTCAKNSKQSDYCSSFTIMGNNAMNEIMQSTCISNPMIIVILVIVVFIAVGAVGAMIFIFHRFKLRLRKKENLKGKETIPLLEISQPQKKHFVSDVDKPSLSLKWRFSGKTKDNPRKPWLLDLVLNPDDDLIVTDGANNELKKFSLEGKPKSKLAFKTRPDCLALTDRYFAMVTFPHETVLRVINTEDALSVVSTIPFRSQCAGIGSMKDGRLIIGNRESKSVFLCSRDGNILEEIKTGSSGETLFRKPSYVRVVDNRTIYVSDYRTEEFFIININDDNTFAINKHKINYPRTSCVVDGMLLVAASNIRLFKLDGSEAGELLLDGVHHVRGLAFSEDKRLLAITHKSDAEEEISVYEVTKH